MCSDFEREWRCIFFVVRVSSVLDCRKTLLGNEVNGPADSGGAWLLSSWRIVRATSHSSTGRVSFPTSLCVALKGGPRVFSEVSEFLFAYSIVLILVH